MSESQESQTEESSTSASVSLSTLSPSAGSRRPRKRLGHGSGSGLGKTSGKGHKGQKSRSGARIPAGFEGGQMPLHRRLPKRGFISRKRVRSENVYSIVAIEKIVALGESEVTVELLREKGLVGAKPPKVKVLGGSAVEKAISLDVHAISASAKAAVEGAGGSVTIRS